MGTTDFQRARRPEQKAQRRVAILDAAKALALRDGVRAVSLSAIAEAVGIHKSALLRYFETREQIYLEVAIRVWHEWAAQTRASVLALDNGDAVPAVLAASFADRPILCDLLGNVALHLERHVSAGAARAYKHASIGSVAEVVAALEDPLPELDAERRGELVSAAALHAGMLWQIAHPGPALAEVYATEPELGHFAADFRGRLERLLTVMLAGLRSL